MTWKSYATVSGATVLAGWLASSSPVPAPATPARSRPPAAAPGPADIVQQAERLTARVTRERAYAAPARDPFRFAARAPAAAQAAPGVDEGSADMIPPADRAPSAPVVTLSGIAEDQVDGRAVRTAVLSVPSDVLLVQEGADVLGRFRVVRIESEAVDLLDLTTGATVRLALR